MTAKDRWTDQLSCPKCKTIGTAEIWQYDGWSFSNGDQNTYVGEVSEGFKVVSSGARQYPVIVCAKCNP